tara:strand:+ start:24 stop:584 length:561 start_codon:yes stop_codon:yes gene_type:complete
MLSLMNVLVLAIYIYFVSKNMNNLFNVGLSTILVILFLCYNKSGFDLNDYLDKSNINTNNVTDSGGAQGQKDNKPSLNMGPYDGLCLKTGNEEYWMKSPDETTLLSNDKLYTYLSSQGPIKMRLSDQSALMGPPIDGVKGSDEKMFMLANNVTSPLCCPSTFSTSTGCLCTTKNQRDFVNSRGNIN